MSVDGLRVIFSIINLGILYLILRHFLFKPVNKVISDRETEVANTIDNAKADEQKAKELKLENEQLLKEAKNEGKHIVESFKGKAEQVSTDIISDAHKEAELIMQRAKKEAEREKAKAQEEIKHQVVDLAVILSQKALEESIDEEKHRKLIDEFISKVGI